MRADEARYRQIQRNAGETPPTTDEEALGNVLAAFPAATVLPFEPLSAIAEADAALTEDDRPSSWRAVDLREHLEQIEVTKRRLTVGTALAMFPPENRDWVNLRAGTCLSARQASRLAHGLGRASLNEPPDQGQSYAVHRTKAYANRRSP